MILTRSEIKTLLEGAERPGMGLQNLRNSAGHLAYTALALFEHIDQIKRPTVYNGPDFFSLRYEHFKPNMPVKPAHLTDLCRNCGGFSQTLRAGKPWTCDYCGAVQ